jgi:putative hydrolase of the HAD superfamily
MPASSIAAVLFDLDDTILDRRTTLDRYLVNLPRRGLVPQAIAEQFRARFHELDECGYSDRRSMFRQLVAEFADVGHPDELRDDYRIHAWKDSVLAKGAGDVLAWCRQYGMRLGIVTNGSSTVQRAKLDALRLWDRVDTVAIADEEGVAKPAAEVFHRAAARLGVTAAACLVVGDNPRADIVGARNAGMRHVWIRAGLPWPPDVDVPSHSLAHLDGLPDLISQLGE